MALELVTYVATSPSNATLRSAVSDEREHSIQQRLSKVYEHKLLRYGASTPRLTNAPDRPREHRKKTMVRLEPART